MTDNRSQSNRGQTALGAVFGLAILLAFSIGAFGVGYAYITSPAVSPTDTTTEAAIIGDHLVYEELAADTSTTTAGGGPKLDPDAVEKFFRIDAIGAGSDDTAALEDHRVVENTDDLIVNVTIEHAEVPSEESIFNDSIRYHADTASGGQDGEIPTWSEEYTKPAVYEGELVIIRVNTWKEV
jgi:hypothetical protein